MVATQNVGKGPRNFAVLPAANLMYITEFWADELALTQDTILSPGTPAKLAFTTQPGLTNIVGVAFAGQPAVAVEDSSGNVVTDSVLPVTLSITAGSGSSGAILSGTSAVNAQYGIATFGDLSIDLAGKGYTLTATSGALTTAISLTFDVLHPGDANGDGEVNMGDVTEVEREILSYDAITPGADANLDGQINMGDVTKIERLILRLD